MASVIDLTSVYAKIARAEEHFEQVHIEIGEWIKSGHHTFVMEANSSYTRHCLFAVQHGPNPDYLRWTIILGDCINNLRCALDHLIYAVAKYQTVGDPTAKIDSLSFVIAETPRIFKDAGNRLRGLSPMVLDAIESLQPYMRNHPVLPPLLGILRDFSNADKHRLLRLASGGTVSTQIYANSKLDMPRTIYINPEPIEHYAPICCVESPQSDPHFQFDPACQFGMEVCLWHGLREGETDILYQRTGYSVVIQMLIDEVNFVVHTVLRATL